MIKYPVKDSGNQEIREVNLIKQVFDRSEQTALLARIFNYQRSRQRGGNASTKVRSEVKGGGRKPFRQKGTGNARQGTIRAPQCRGGGIIFGPHPHSYATRMPKNERRLALLTALTVKRKAGELLIIEDFCLEGIKTQALRDRLDVLQVFGSALIVLKERDAKVELSARNLPGVNTILEAGINAYDLFAHDTVIIVETALNKLQERLV